MINTLYDLCLINILFQPPDPIEVTLLPDYYKDHLFDLFNRTIRYKIQKVKSSTYVPHGCFLFKATPFREISDMISFMYKVESWAIKLGGLERSWKRYVSSLDTSGEVKSIRSFERGLSVNYF